MCSELFITLFLLALTSLSAVRETESELRQCVCFGVTWCCFSHIHRTRHLLTKCWHTTLENERCALCKCTYCKRCQQLQREKKGELGDAQETNARGHKQLCKWGKYAWWQVANWAAATLFNSLTARFIFFSQSFCMTFNFSRWVWFSCPRVCFPLLLQSVISLCFLSGESPLCYSFACVDFLLTGTHEGSFF